MFPVCKNCGAKVSINQWLVLEVVFTAVVSISLIAYLINVFGLSSMVESLNNELLLALLKATEIGAMLTSILLYLKRFKRNLFIPRK